MPVLQPSLLLTEESAANETAAETAGNSEAAAANANASNDRSIYFGGSDIRPLTGQNVELPADPGLNPGPGREMEFCLAHCKGLTNKEILSPEMAGELIDSSYEIRIKARQQLADYWRSPIAESRSELGKWCVHHRLVTRLPDALRGLDLELHIISGQVLDQVAQELPGLLKASDLRVLSSNCTPCRYEDEQTRCECMRDYYDPATSGDGFEEFCRMTNS